MATSIRPELILNAGSLKGALETRALGDLDASEVVASITGATLELAKQACTRLQRDRIKHRRHKVSGLALPGKAFKNHRAIAANKFRNLLYFLGLLDPPTYSWVHANCLYRHGNSAAPTRFANFIITQFPEIITDKTCLEIGPGNGKDSVAFSSLASSVEMIENSRKMVEILQGKESKAESFHAPENAEDMFIALKRIKKEIESGERRPLDFIYSHSSVHFYNDPEFLELIDLCNDCLVDGGHLAIGMKAPNSLFDGSETTHLIRQEIETAFTISGSSSDSLQLPALHFGIGSDGITRAFRHEMTIQAHVENREFSSVYSSNTEIENYEVTGSRQKMLQFIFKKNPKKLKNNRTTSHPSTPDQKSL